MWDWFMCVHKWFYNHCVDVVYSSYYCCMHMLTLCLFRVVNGVLCSLQVTIIN